MASQYQIPATPRIISPSPTPSEASGKDGYFPTQTRSQTRSKTAAMTARKASIEPIDEHHDEEDHDFDRARSRSRSPQIDRRPGRQAAMNGSTTTQANTSLPPITATGTSIPRKKDSAPTKAPNGFLSPTSAEPLGYGSAYWRNLSRSPSPLGLIPIHREWRAFIHKHEVPRKALHVSIGFLALYLYSHGAQPADLHPFLLSLLVPIFATDLLRFRWDAFNRVYIRTLGAFMRESEAHDRYNGVIYYIAGLWFTTRCCNIDVGVVSVLLLSWCDTAASTFGRRWGKYTPRIRKGKSLAGSLAAAAFGVGAAVLFWGWVAPSVGRGYDGGEDALAFTGRLTLPARVREALGWSVGEASLDGPWALGVLSVVAGVVASVSEAVDLWDLDDNLTIPVFCGLGLGAFLWMFGGS